jgi:RHS repeat-associated protein
VTITSPAGLKTDLSLDTNGWVSQINYPSAMGGTYSYASGVAIKATPQLSGLLTDFTDARGKKSSFQFDPMGRLTKDSEPTSTPVGGSKTLTLHTDAWQVDVTTAEGRTTSHRIDVDANGSITRTRTDSDGSVTTALHPPDGSALVTSPAGTTKSTVVPDPLFGTATPRLSSMSFQPDPSLPTSTITVAETAHYVTPTAVLSGQQRTRDVTLNGGPTWTTSHDPIAPPTDHAASTVTSKGPQLTNTSRPATTATLDIKGRVKEIALPWASEPIKVLYYGETGAPTGQPQLSGKPYTITQGTRVVTLNFDSATGFLTSVKDPLLQTTIITPDGLGRTRKVTAPDNSVLAMTPDEGGLLMSLTPPGKLPHQFTYDDKGRPKTYVPPAGSDVTATTETTSYTTDGLFSSVTSPGVTTSALSLTYEPTGKKRLSGVIYPDKHIDVTYDDTITSSPRLKSLSSNGEVLTLGWTGGVLTSLKAGPATAQHTVSWPTTGFDSALRPTQEQLDASNTLTTGFDNDGFPLSTSDGSWTLTHHRAPSGLVDSAAFSNGSTSLHETFGHEASFGEPNDYAFTVGNAASPLYRVEILARDALGRIRLRRETVAGTPLIRQYDYDAQGRLKTESSCSGVTGTGTAATCTSPSQLNGWSYDGNGNRNPTPLTPATTCTYDGQDRLTDVGSTHYTYTTDGRLQTKVVGGQTTTYGYDVAGSLQSVGWLGTTVAYTVDALGRRVERRLNGVVTARWVYGKGLGPVAEFNAAGTLVARYVYARGKNVPDWAITQGGVYRFVTDERGSVRLVVKAATGAVVRKSSYDAWGVMMPQPPDVSDNQAPPLTFGFAGGLYDDDTKLVRFGARDYDPQVGRWTGKDPIRLGGGDTNFYKYAGSDPVNNSDPSGLIVSICSDPADLPGTYFTGARHNWLMTDLYQGGQGPDGGWGIGTKITTIGHTNRSFGPDAVCTPVDHVDEDCVDRMLKSDISSGVWLWDNTCRDTAEAIVQVCTSPGSPNAATTMPVHNIPSGFMQDARKNGYLPDADWIHFPLWFRP